MAAIPVTSANSNRQRQGARVGVRNSSGTPYVVVEDFTAGGIEIWKGNSTTPASFSEQDNTNNPQTTGYGSCSAAIDSTDIIHIVYAYYNGKSSEIRYVTFDADGTTDTFAGDTSVVAIGSDPVPAAVSSLSTAIAIDTNDIPHIAYTRFDSDMGSDWYGIYYQNRIGGTWGTEVGVEAVATNKNCKYPDIAIDLDNIPVISYSNEIDDDVGTAEGDANDPTTFTLNDIDTDHEGAAGSRASIAVDSSGNVYVAYKDRGDSFGYINKHNYGDAWTSWQTRISNSNGVINPSLAINGTDLYMFYEDSSAEDIFYDKYTGTWGSGTWLGETLLETGTYDNVKTKWAFEVNRGSNGTNYGGISGIPEIDYVFADNVNDIWWNTLSIGGAAPARRMIRISALIASPIFFFATILAASSIKNKELSRRNFFNPFEWFDT